MPNPFPRLRVLALFASLASHPLLAQAPAPPSDPVLAAARDAAHYMRAMLTAAAEQMSEEDYAFRPTPEVRTFGQLLAHVAQSNYQFCAPVRGDSVPVLHLEQAATTRAQVRSALIASFEYCDTAYAAAEGERGQAMIPFMGERRPRLVVLLFRTHHAALHYGNVVTYMRLRGKVPPSSQGTDR